MKLAPRYSSELWFTNFIISVFLLFSTSLRAGHFDDLGVPVKSTLIMGATIGVDEKNHEVIYFNCAQEGNKLFLLQVNPRNGKSRQFGGPVGEGAWAIQIAPDNRIYLGTWESGYLLRFDPHHSEKGIESLGKPSPSETYLWQFALAKDGRLYGCTYPGAKLVRYDFASGKPEDLGRMDPVEMYARSLAAATNGFLYIGIGMARAQVVRFDPATGEKKNLFKEDQRPPGVATVFQAANDQVYARVGSNLFRCDGNVLTPVENEPAKKSPKLRDGRVLSDWSTAPNGTLVYTLEKPSGKNEQHKVKFESTGVEIFALGGGPEGRIYGSTVLPLEIFGFTPATKELRHLGNSPGGEVYSFGCDGKQLYYCSYPGGVLSRYNPKAAWHFGATAQSNPRCFGSMGNGHLRPRAMVIGPDERVYIGSLPPYGQVGGGFGVFDPKVNKVVENYRGLVPDQGISALCVEPVTQTIFGGSSIGAGGGGRAVAKECVVFAWDWKQKKKIRESVVVAGDHTVVALTTAHGKVFGVSHSSNTLFVLDGETHTLLHKSRIPFGSVHEISLEFYPPHDLIYGLAGNKIFAIDPKTFSVSEIATNPQPITCGFAVTETGIYFGSKTHLMRWTWN